MRKLICTIALLLALSLLYAKIQRQTLGSLVMENIPRISDDLIRELDPYLDTRYASFRGWIPPDNGILIRTRLDNVSQLHHVEYPKAFKTPICILCCLTIRRIIMRSIRAAIPRNNTATIKADDSKPFISLRI